MDILRVSQAPDGKETKRHARQDRPSTSEVAEKSGYFSLEALRKVRKRTEEIPPEEQEDRQQFRGYSSEQHPFVKVHKRPENFDWSALRRQS